MNWLSLYDCNTILQKHPRLIASDIIDFISIYEMKRS
jgi:hypothetical protein